LSKPLIAINTLQAMTMSPEIEKIKTQNPKFFCPMLDARRMEVYCALYDETGKEIMPSTAKIIDENSFSDEIKKGRVIFFGDGAEKCKNILQKKDNVVFIDNVFPSAKNMCALSFETYQKKQFENTAYFEPSYLKEFYSEKSKKNNPL
jgi:tRNA threonylcarbamoyladenosine biosynthesis protein TsaB